MFWLIIGVLIFVGLAFLVLEILVIPGTGIAGIIGFILMGIGIWQAYSVYGSTAGHYTLGGTIVLTVLMLILALRSKTWKKIMLKKKIDSRVNVIERMNVKKLTHDYFDREIDFITADLSFISLRKVLPACVDLLKPGGWCFLLVKPQFEAMRQEVSKGGVVRDPVVQKRCVDEICEFAVNKLKWRRAGIVPSPIKGPAGNQEYITVFRTGLRDQLEP